MLVDTLASLERTNTTAEVIAILDGAHQSTRNLIPRDRISRVIELPNPQGGAACFNRLVQAVDADYYVLLENGAWVGPGWLDLMLDAIGRNSAVGLAGPSTNHCWNEQRVFAGAGGTPSEIDHTAAAAMDRFGAGIAYMEPLHSLGDFCYVVRRGVIDKIGAADEAYGLGPCWEMDYNVRAARAGFRSVWTKAAYVWRPPFTNRRQAEQAALFEQSKRRYQDHHCGLRLNGAKLTYESHCRGDACPHFSPPAAIRIHRSFDETPAVPAASTPSIETAGSDPGKPLVSCIMPTANRRKYVPSAIESFLRQDHEPKELIIVDDGDDAIGDLVPDDPRIRYIRENQRLTIGAKRNLACNAARGDVIAHWDDDDWHADWRLSYQLQQLQVSQADMCGLTRLYFYDADREKAWQYRYPGGPSRWLAGGTLCYRKSLWQSHRFVDVTIGEDTRYVRGASMARIAELDRDDFYVARVHSANTSPKHTTGPSWVECDVATIRRFIGHQFDEFAAVQKGRAVRRPLVSCIMPTFDRRPFVPLSLERFAEQDYPNRELLVVDDGSDPIGDLLDGIPGVRYIRLRSKLSIGEKRNIACSEAAGEIVVQWDDDDWYGRSRLRAQAQPIIDGIVDITGIQGRRVMVVPGGDFWHVGGDLHRRMFFADVHGGTLAFRRSIWTKGIHYPDCSLGEDAAWLRLALGAGHRLDKIHDDTLFVYTRHQNNAWRFTTGQFIDPNSWARSTPPNGLSQELIGAYCSAGQQCLSRSRMRAMGTR
jgi:glycosyltransferase involved in cell wall biosynthesis